MKLIHFLCTLSFLAGRKWQHYLDLSAPHTGPRWVVTALVILFYCLRVYLINGVFSAHCSWSTDPVLVAAATIAVVTGRCIRSLKQCQLSARSPKNPDVWLRTLFLLRLVHRHLRAGNLRAQPADRLLVAAERPGD